MEQLIADNEVAGFLYEPFVQGEAGMQLMDGKGLDSILRFLKAQHILTVADEVMTGFGKTGPYFASDAIPTKPDVVCLSKALTGGMVPMGLTTCTSQVYEAFLSEQRAKGFFHGHTYSANPLACRAAKAAIDLLKSPDIAQNRQRIGGCNARFSEAIQGHPKVCAVRTTGVILALDVKLDILLYSAARDAIYEYFMAGGIYYARSAIRCISCRLT